ncbi:MAG: hypothetical protein OH337_03840 [Candidatus Parvarchaeota archaeon]|nr:hypothetical protein [Candidatus Haiyanarchaeum thermophilum]
MRPRNAFTSLDDFIHAIVGFAASILKSIHLYGVIISLIITLIFMVYQALEAESRVQSVEDIVEFTAGFIFGEIVQSFFRYSSSVLLFSGF